MKRLAKQKKTQGRRLLTFERRKKWTGYIFLAPWLIGGIVLLVYPLLFSFALSFSELQNFTTYSMEWVGLENYRRAFLEDVDYITCITWLFRQLFYNMPLIVIFSLLMAILVSRDIRGKGFFRSVFFLPVLIGTLDMSCSSWKTWGSTARRWTLPDS